MTGVLTRPAPFRPKANPDPAPCEVGAAEHDFRSGPLASRHCAGCGQPYPAWSGVAPAAVAPSPRIRPVERPRRKRAAVEA